MKVLLISDIHGNLEALKEVLMIENWDYIYCMGDIVDYGPSPQECVDIIREKGITVKGNHDNAVATGMDCGCSYEIKELSQEVRKYTVDSMSPKNIEYLASLPVSVGKKGTYITHASRDDLFGYLKPNTPEEEFNVFDDLEEDTVLLGHTHIPMDREINGRRYINPGSLGQPRDGDTRAAYGILEDGELYLRRTEYDMDTVLRKMESADLPSRAMRILRAGKVVP